MITTALTENTNDRNRVSSLCGDDRDTRPRDELVLDFKVASQMRLSFVAASIHRVDSPRFVNETLRLRRAGPPDGLGLLVTLTVEPRIAPCRIDC